MGAKERIALRGVLLALLVLGAAPAPPASAARATPEARATGGRDAEDATGDAVSAAHAARRALGPPAFTGRAIDAGGNPLAGARVVVAPLTALVEHRGARVVQRLLRAPSMEALRLETTTDADGRFALLDPVGALDAPADARLELEVAARGFAPLALHALTLPGAGTLDLGELVLRDGRHVEGLVRDADGLPVSDARIGLARVEPDAPGASGGMATATALATTGRDGTFEADGVPPGTWTLVVAAGDAPETRFEAVVSDAAELAPLHLALPRAAALEGHVLSEPERGFTRVLVHALPLARLAVHASDRLDAALVLGARTARVDADGRFRVHGLERGRAYALRALPEGVEPTGADAWAGAALVRAPMRDVRLVMRWGAALELDAVDAHGAPIEQFAIEVDGAVEAVAARDAGADHAVRRHAGGHVRLDELRPPPGTSDVRVHVRAPGHVPWRSEAYTLLPGGTVQLGRVMLAARPTLSLRVVDAAGGEPVEGAVARIVHSSGTVAEGASDAHGRIVLEDRPDGQRRLGVVARGFAPTLVEAPFTPADGELVVALEPEAAIAVSVVGADGTPAVGVPVANLPPAGEGHERAWAPDVATPRVARTDTRGIALFAGLGPGLHEFGIVRRGALQGYERGTVRLAEGALGTLALTADFESRLRGVVLDLGRPLPGASLAWSRGSGGVALGLATDERGRFEAIVERGGWRVSITAERVRPVELEVVLERDTEDLVLQAGGGGSWMQAVLPGGAAAAGARVHDDVASAPLEIEPGMNAFALAASRSPAAIADGRGLVSVDRRTASGLVAFVPSSDGGHDDTGLHVATGAVVDLPIENDDPLLVLQPAASLVLERERWSPPGDARALLLVHDRAFPSLPARIVFPYRGERLELDGLLPGTWTAWIVELDGLGRARTAVPVAAIDLVAGQRTHGALPR